ncbi:MAG: DUF3098 domain-containing protein [candidate division Zixibacteria bacterium]|nr:DUF3098 domain-containing protein [candidate division Zixibacteria bacterium]MCI0595976.1 DUF3098 domain-containing protein [candidate division Zixibacteria bacterium]
MAQPKPAVKGKPAPKIKAETGPIFGKRNYILFAVGLLVIIAGFIFLGTGDTVFAPILLVLGYCVIIPVAIIIKDKKKEPEAPPAFQSTDRPVTPAS